jgi:hypothetical protein
LLALCRQFHDGFSNADVSTTGGGAFLMDLSRAFEGYLAAQLRDQFFGRPEWRICSAKFPWGRLY